MTIVRTSTLLLLALSLGIGVAVAAPTSTGGGPPVSESCPTPDKATCLKKGYLDSYCGSKHKAVCKPYAIAALEKHYNASDAPKIKMLRPGRSQIPADVRQGKYEAYVPGASVATIHAGATANSYRKAGDVMRKRTGMDMARIAPMSLVAGVDPDVAKNYHRTPAWDANGDRVESCAEFAYERSYDVTRYIDAASACKGDRECVFDITYMAGKPGIASRTLKDTGTRSLASLQLTKGTKPKNDMFQFGKSFVRSNGTREMEVTPDMVALETALETGKAYYSIDLCDGAACNNTRKFDDEWKFHKRLHDRTENVSISEAEEYERRRAQFRALIEQWSAAAGREQAMLHQQTIQEIVLPYDMRAQNPWDRYERVNEYIEEVRTYRQQTKAKWGAGILNKSLEQAMKQVHGSRGGVSPAAVLAMPSASQRNAALWALPPAEAAKPTGFQMGEPGVSADIVPGQAAGPSYNSSQCLRTTDWSLEMDYGGPISCRIGEFLRAEWMRKKAGYKSCLDLNNDHCDWRHEMFEAAILAKVPLLDKQLQDETFCKAWSDGGTFPKNSVASVQTELEENQTAFEEIWPIIKAYDRGAGTHGHKFGKDWTGGDYLGDKFWFAAGYDYDTGWDVQPTGKDDGYICELGGTIHAKTGFDAWIVGGKVEVVDGSVTAESNVGSSGEVRFKGHLEMFDQSVFSTGGWKVATTFGDDPAGNFGVQLPNPKPRFDIYVGVPISGQLWGELLFGSSLSLTGKAGGCNKTSPEFSVAAKYAPFFGAFGVGKVGVGIAGVASAGVRAAVTLVMISLPVDMVMKAQKKNGSQKLTFNSGLSLMLATLSGRLSLYVEFLTFEEEFEMFRWKGIGPADVPLMPRINVDVPLSGID